MVSDRRDAFLSVKTRADLASFLKIPTKELTFFAYSKKSFYRSFLVQKRDGKGVRQIDAPKGKLKDIQRVLAELFSEFYDPQDSTYGFLKGRSVADNAAWHVNKRCIIKIDLKDFFPSISTKRIHGLFLHPPFEFNDEVANTLANLVCHNGSLPQGAPTSPVLSNMICFRLDRAFLQQARSNGLKYTRYADDLVFSSTKRSADYSMIHIDETGHPILNQHIVRIIENNGFKVNESKTGLFGKGTRQVVTGIVVNKKCNFRRDDYRYLRSLFHHWITTDNEESAATYYVSHDSRRRYRSRLFAADGTYISGKLPAHIRGLLDYYSMIESVNKRESEPLQKLWTEFHECTGERVPMMVPEYSILQTDSCYKYRVGNADSQDGGSLGTAFVLRGYGLITACHCIREISANHAQYDDSYIVNMEDMNEHCRYSFKTPSDFSFSLADDWAIIPTVPNEFSPISGLSISKDFFLQRGEKVVAYGYADGKRQFRRIEARVAEVLEDNTVVVDRAFIKGMSGGPVLNSRGQVVGVVTWGSGDHLYDKDGRFILLNAIPI